MPYKQGQTVRLDNRVYRLDSGILGLGEVNAEGRLRYIQLYFAGDLLRINEEEYRDLYAITEAELSAPASYGDLSESLEKQLHRTRELVLVRSLPLDEGLARLLDLLASRIGKPEDASTVIVPLTQQQLAHMLGGSRESVGSILPKLLKKKRLNPIWGGVRWPKSEGAVG